MTPSEPLGLLTHPPTTETAVGALQSPLGLPETADDYPVVAALNSGWRVIVCRNGIQWILQRRAAPGQPLKNDWRGRSYCQTSEALIRCVREHAGEIDPAACTVLAALPARLNP